MTPNPTDAFNCFTTGTLADTECFIGGGFMSLFGGAELLGIVLLGIFVILGFYLRLAFDLFAVFMLTGIYIYSGIFFPEYVLWVAVIFVFTWVAYGFYKFYSARG